MNVIDNNFVNNKWIPALRSGDFLQGVGQFHSASGKDGAYCVLGVANSLLCEGERDEWSDELTCFHESVLSRDIQFVLTCLNDDHLVTFTEFATLFSEISSRFDWQKEPEYVVAFLRGFEEAAIQWR